MPDREKFKKLFDEVGIVYIEEGDKICIDTSEVNGAEQEICIQFYSEEMDGKFQEFIVYPQ